MAFVAHKAVFLTRRGGAITSSDPDVSAWIGAVQAAGGSVSQGYATALTTFVSTLKTNSLWVWDWMQPLATENAVQAKIDLVSRRNSSTGWINSPTWTSLLGVQFNGSTNYIDSKYNPATQATNALQNANSWGVVVETEDTIASSSAYVGNNSSHTFVGRQSTTNHWHIINVGVGSTSWALGASTGNYHCQRTTSSVSAAFKEGVSVSTSANASVAFDSFNWTIGGCGAPSRPSNGRYAFAYIGGQISGSEATFNTALNAFLHAINGSRW